MYANTCADCSHYATRSPLDRIESLQHRRSRIGVGGIGQFRTDFQPPPRTHDPANVMNGMAVFLVEQCMRESTWLFRFAVVFEISVDQLKKTKDTVATPFLIRHRIAVPSDGLHLAPAHFDGDALNLKADRLRPTGRFFIFYEVIEIVIRRRLLIPKCPSGGQLFRMELLKHIVNEIDENGAGAQARQEDEEPHPAATTRGRVHV
jgi:hypothetical protein